MTLPSCTPGPVTTGYRILLGGTTELSTLLAFRIPKEMTAPWSLLSCEPPGQPHSVPFPAAGPRRLERGCSGPTPSMEQATATRQDAGQRVPGGSLLPSLGSLSGLLKAQPLGPLGPHTKPSKGTQKQRGLGARAHASPLNGLTPNTPRLPLLQPLQGPHPGTPAPTGSASTGTAQGSGSSGQGWVRRIRMFGKKGLLLGEGAPQGSVSTKSQGEDSPEGDAGRPRAKAIMVLQGSRAAGRPQGTQSLAP